MDTVKNNIRKLRFDMDMSQEGLSLVVGISRQSIMSVEHGETYCSILNALKIAKALEAPLEDVFEYVVDEPKPRRKTKKSKKSKKSTKSKR